MSPKRIALLAAGALFCATAAFAQTTGSGGTGPDTGPAQPGYTKHDPSRWMKGMCVEHYARSASRLAYLEARLQLTPDQQPLWDKYQQAMTSGAVKERDECLASIPAAGHEPTILDREDRFEKLMSAKLASMQASHPALETLYQALTPEQRVAFDRPMHRHHGDFGHHRKPEAQPQPL
jgi:periplasmic protein CpxP/Spy